MVVETCRKATCFQTLNDVLDPLELEIPILLTLSWLLLVNAIIPFSDWCRTLGLAVVHFDRFASRTTAFLQDKKTMVHTDASRLLFMLFVYLLLISLFNIPVQNLLIPSLSLFFQTSSTL